YKASFVKGGGLRQQDGGIVKTDNQRKTIPQSASLTAPFTKEPFYVRTFYTDFSFVFYSPVNLYGTPRLSWGFRYTINKKKLTFLSAFFAVFSVTEY
ncbi:MAG: hypothetical protein IJX02_02215, partial [Clostridia bacterium]|nr:hypothetical protein [Clostridia bacterium]